MLFVLHLGGALYHQFVRRDLLLARMGVGRA
jgi:cytochrome b561